MLLNWQTHGGHGPHLLLVHGFLSSAAQWQCNLEGLRQHFQPVTVELLGHGGSAAPEDDEPYLPDTYVAQFDAIRTQLSADSWFLLGYSMGAGLTIRYAQQHPQHVLGHAFTNSTSAFADAKQQASMQSYGEQQASQIIEQGRPAIERLAVHPSRAMSLDPSIKAALVADAARLDPVGVAQTLRHTLPGISVREQLGSNSTPALLLWGQRERRFKPLAQYASQHMPKLSVINLPAGHGVNMEQPVVFNEHLAEFKQQCLTS
ncbi:MAG: alpha/beta fold hydrolase [Pseudomonadales bacterium]